MIGTRNIGENHGLSVAQTAPLRDRVLQKTAACRPEQREGSDTASDEILRSAQNDNGPFTARCHHGFSIRPTICSATRQMASCWAVATEWPTSATRLLVPVTSVISLGKGTALLSRS